MRNFSPPNVNAGSIADIAFLLLIFFLVTATIPKDKGISRKLTPPCPTGTDCNADIAKQNVLPILINQQGEFLIKNKVVEKENLAETVMEFLDNNGDKSCDYCFGTSDPNSSDNPQKAIISLSSHRLAPYKSFVAVQDELTKAYESLRKKYVENVLKKEVNELTEAELEQVRQAYPMKISETEVR